MKQEAIFLPSVIIILLSREYLTNHKINGAIRTIKKGVLS